MGLAVFKHVGLAVGLLVASVAAAEAANHGWYWGLEAGLDHPNDFSYVDTWVHSTYTNQMNNGAAVMGTLGGYLGSQLRVEG